ncbi:MAG: CoA-binding protein [Candidatus Pacebacteria bacterium]|nr:CoA-binding protein [Candidatus Paceibacterota bacterium]
MLNNIFNPKTIALIGASEEPKTVGSGIALNLLKSKKKIFFVNIKQKKIFKKKVYKSILEIKEKIDLAIIAVPGGVVSNIALECVQKKVKGVIVISAGFSENGNMEREKELKDILDKANIPLVGPNCLGIVNTKNNLNASFAPFIPKKGNIALLSQSGAIIDSIIDISRTENYGFSKIVSFGNEAGLDLSDYLNYLVSDKETSVIAIYIEGIKNGRKFLETASKVSKVKPIIVLKSGKTKLGKSAALTHTGSLAGDSKIYSSVFKQTGVIEVNSIEELLLTAKALSFNKRFKNGVGIVTNGGGFGVLAVDYLDAEKIKVPQLKKETLKFLDVPVLKNIKGRNNPFDVLGDALADRYEVVIEAMLKQEDIHCLLVIQGLQVMTEPEKTAKIIIKLQKRYEKPIIVSFIGGESFKKAISIIEKNKITNITEIEKAVKVIKYLTYEK